MTSAWLRRFWAGISVVAAATLSGCASNKGRDSGAEIPESPPTATADASEPAWTDPAPVTHAEPAPIPEEPQVHVVRKGDTLFSLARHYYAGDASKWRRIYEANRDRITDKDRIKVGQELIIPD
jgi:nucleoid-associated protein YgaU